MAKLSRKRLPQGRKGCAYYDTSFFRFSRLTVLEPDWAVTEAAGGAECRPSLCTSVILAKLVTVTRVTM